MSILEAEGLHRSFVTKRDLLGRPSRHLVAVDDVDIHIDSGETVGLVGESGSGKSTLARLLTRLIEPDAGRVVIDGTEWTALNRRDLRRARGSAQMVFQDPYASLDPTKTVADVLGEPLRIHEGLPKRAAEQRCLELLDLVGLPAAHLDRYSYEFSGGQRQRVAIARALAVKPSLVIADEAVSALDVSTQAQVLNLLLDLQEEQQLAYLFISHDLGVVRQMSDRIAIMYLGRIVEQGPAETVYTAPKHPYTVALLSAVPEVDVSRRSERRRLTGESPSPTNLPSGCRFHPRCPEAIDVCRNIEPTTVELGPVRVACHLYGEPVSDTSPQSTSEGTT